MTTFLLLDNQRVVNLDQVVSAKFSPAQNGVDDESGKPYSSPCQLLLTMSSVSRETIYGFDGGFLGAVATSDYEVVKGENAYRLWDLLQKDWAI